MFFPGSCYKAWSLREIQYKNRAEGFFSLLYYNNQAIYNKIFFCPALKIELVRAIILKLGDNIQANTAGRLIVGYAKGWLG
jgi:hypothetical protein